MEREWCDALMQCAERLYVIEEESHRIMWMNDCMINSMGNDCTGELCWKAFFGREAPCQFCPRLSVGDDVYMWDYYDSKNNEWMKIKHMLFEQNGVIYRAGNVNLLDDVMQLNYDTVQEIAMLQRVLFNHRGEVLRLEKQAIYDTLTGLYNRNYFHQDLEELYVNTPQIGILYFDLNNLKETNDLYRHETGDELLRRMAEVLRHVTRHQKNAKCYRIGGDEFTLIVRGVDEAGLDRLAKLFTDYMNAYNKNETHQCSVAVGRAFSETACDPEALVSKADEDMYGEKQKMKRGQSKC